MLPYRNIRIARVALVIFFLIVVGYGYFEARGYLFGPSITITSGAPAIATSSYALIEGSATHVASLMMDGGPLQITVAGAFQAPYVLAPGDNRIVLDAKDKYGHATEKVVTIVYVPPATTATTTRSTALTSASSTTSGTSSSDSSPISSDSATGTIPAAPADVAPGR